jgi:hypothetical protein
LLIVVPQLRFAQFNTDDYSQLAVLEGIEIHRGLSPLNLYGFVNGDPDLRSLQIAYGPTVWYADPTEKINFFRPLSSALVTATHSVAGLDPLPYAIHGLLWYLVAIASLGLLVRRVFLVPRGGRSHPAVYLALVIFAVSASNCSTVMWNAARWILVSTALGLAGLAAHMKWREDGWRPGLFLSVPAFGAALLAGEASIAVLAFLAAYELIGNPDPLRRRLTALLPTTSLVMVYLAYYKSMGWGSEGLQAYLDPLENPTAFISALPSKMLAMLGELFLGIGSAAWFFPERRMQTVLAGLAAILFFGALLYPLLKRAPRTQRRRIVWIIVGTLGALLPLAARMPNPHILMIPLVGSSSLVAFIVYYSFRRARRKPGVQTGLGFLASLVFVFILLVRPPFAWFEFGRGWQEAHERLVQFHSRGVVSEIQPHQKAVFMNFNSWDLEFHGYYYRQVARLPMPEAWWHLSRSSLRHRYHRTALDTLEMELIDGGIQVASTGMSKGDVRRLPGLEITILEFDQAGIHRVRFKFEKPLTDPLYRFMAWRGDSLEVVDLPQVGESVSINPNRTIKVSGS